MAYNGNLLKTIGIPNERIIDYGSSFDSSNSGLFKGSYDWDYNLNTPVDSFYLQTPYTPDFNLSSGDISLEAYFNANSFSAGMCILASDTYGSNYDWNLLINSSTDIQVWTQQGINRMIVTVPTMNVGQWYHVKFERVAGVNRIYLDGVSYGGTTTFGISDSSQFYITVGCSSWNNPGLHFDGYLDKVKIINNGLTVLNLEFESIDVGNLTMTDVTGKIFEILPDPIDIPQYILDTKNSPNSPELNYIPIHIDIVRSNLILNYETVNTLSYDRIGTSIFDLTRNQHTGTLTNGPMFDTTNGSLIFDGIDDYIEVINDGLITPTDVSIEAWVYPTNLTGTVNQNVYRLDNAGTPTQMIAFQGSGTILSFGLTTDTTGYAKMDFTINPVTYENTWMHIVATYTDGLMEKSKTALKRLFINGQKVSEATIMDVGSPYGTLWNRDGWADLTDYNTTRVYTDWAATSGYNPPSMVGEEWVMFDYINTKYYKIKFTAWTPGNAGGGFAYNREEILTPSTFGPLVSFTKPDFATGTVDAIDTGLTIKRKNNQGIFNAASETGYVFNGFYYGTGSSGPATFDNTNDLYIGTWIDNLSESFTGKIGAVRLYQTALIPEEVLQNYNANKNNYL